MPQSVGSGEAEISRVGIRPGEACEGRYESVNREGAAMGVARACGAWLHEGRRNQVIAPYALVI
jgi:hypothetical protein